MFTREDQQIISECNKAGIRVYPIPYYNDYKLAVEVRRGNRKPKPKIGEMRYNRKKTVWVDKLLEIYKHWHKKIKKGQPPAS